MLHWYFDADGDEFAEGDIYLGLHGDVPVVGNWDGQGGDNVGVVREHGGLLWWYLNVTGIHDQHQPAFAYGNAGDLPIVIHVAVNVTPRQAPYRLSNWNTAVTWVDFNHSDFDGDGDQDVVGRDQKTGAWWVGRSNGGELSLTNSLWGQWSSAVAWQDVCVGDVNGDGRDDLVGRIGQTGDWWVGRSTGQAFVNEYWGRWSTAVHWDDVQLGDINGDGLADLVGRVRESGQWWAARSDGARFQNALWGQWSASVTWDDVHFEDLDADGDSDLVGRVRESGQWWVGRNNRATLVNAFWGGWAAGQAWTDVMVGDVDGDRDLDVLGRHQASGQWWIGRSNGAAFVSQPFGSWSSSVQWTNVVSLDYDGDGDLDVLGRIGNTGAWWLGRTGPSGMTNEFLAVRPTSSAFSRVFATDVTGDKAPEILAYSATTGGWSADFFAKRSAAILVSRPRIEATGNVEKVGEADIEYGEVENGGARGRLTLNVFQDAAKNWRVQLFNPWHRDAVAGNVIPFSGDGTGSDGVITVAWTDLAANFSSGFTISS